MPIATPMNPGMQAWSDTVPLALSLARVGLTYGTGKDERVYVTCFGDGQIYAVNPFGQSQVEDIISVGRGPYAVDVVPPQTSLMSPPPRYLNGSISACSSGHRGVTSIPPSR